MSSLWDIIGIVEDAYEHYDRDPSCFKDIFKDAKKPLYRVQNIQSYLVEWLYNVKGFMGGQIKGFCLLKLLTNILLNNNDLPKPMYESMKTRKVLGLEHEKIHACLNDCNMYKNIFADLTRCPNCRASSWQRKKDG